MKAVNHKKTSTAYEMSFKQARKKTILFWLFILLIGYIIA
jgi:hypothetical protein